jgi:hypothetical protein
MASDSKYEQPPLPTFVLQLEEARADGGEHRNEIRSVTDYGTVLHKLFATAPPAPKLVRSPVLPRPRRLFFNELGASRVPVSASGARVVPNWCPMLPRKSPISPRSFNSALPPNLTTFPPAPPRSRILYLVPLSD